MVRNTSVEIRKRVIRLSAAEKRSREIASILSIGKSTVNDIIKKYRAGYSVQDRPRSGRPRKPTERINRIIKRKSIADPKKTAVDIATELEAENVANISRYTVSRRLHDIGLFGRVSTKKPLIIGTRHDVKYQTPTVKYGGGNIMVWGAFSAEGIGPLARIEGSMNGVMYRDILKTHLIPYAAEKMPQHWIFQHDNDPKHSSKIVKGWLSANKIKVLDWPSQSPDLNPIEHLWSEIKRQIGKHKKSNKTQLLQILQEEWNKIPHDYIMRLIESMPRRCSAVIAAKGMATKY
ncbi:hypothetical protein KPH14_000807 [Odynerus spinipes]|uniref:Transposase n=1 Tax=Odynerus spinipes TaxID=1348599 RepID=A0AAD9VI08_9HYME|nr:hypothetical protein KPH14_000807 [Odynerus spinipes]